MAVYYLTLHIIPISFQTGLFLTSSLISSLSVNYIMLVDLLILVIPHLAVPVILGDD